MAIEQLNAVISGFGLNPTGKTTSVRSIAQPAILDPVEASAARNSGTESVERLKDLGVREFVNEENKRKLEEIRQEILNNMGLDEDSFNSLTGAEKALVEEQIAREIRSRLEASNFESDDSSLSLNQEGTGPAQEARSVFDNLSNTATPDNIANQVSQSSGALSALSQILSPTTRTQENQGSPNDYSLRSEEQARERERGQRPQVFSILT